MTLRLNNDYKIGDKVVIGHNISAAFSAKINDDPAVVGQAYRLSPIITPYNENGDFSDSQNSSTGNPLATIAYLNNSVRDDRIPGMPFGLDDHRRIELSYQFRVRLPEPPGRNIQAEILCFFYAKK